MSAFPSRHLLVSAIIAVLAVGGIADAHAQTAADRVAERRAAREARQADAKSPDTAAAEYPEATRKEPGLRASSRLSSALNKVSDAQQEGDLAAAEAASEQVLSNERANAYERAITLRLLADLLIDVDNARAKDYMQQAIAQEGLGNNEHYGTMLALAQLQMMEDDFTGALAVLDRMLAETRSDKPELHVLRGNALYRLERYDQAITALAPVVEAHPERADWAQLLMASYSEGGRAGDAAALAEQIAKATPGDKRALLNLASVYLQADDHANAIKVYEQLRQSGEFTEEREYRNLAALYLNSEGGERNAIGVINEGLEKGVMKPDHTTYSSLAQAYYFSDDYGKAIEAYQKAAPLDDDGSTYLNLAKVLFNEGRDAEAKAATQKALDKGLSDPEEARKLLAR